ncbi:hypothetical protein JCM10449v2_006317 [Rhodotorula kratochvilovae]
MPGHSAKDSSGYSDSDDEAIPLSTSSPHKRPARHHRRRSSVPPFTHYYCGRAGRLARSYPLSTGVLLALTLLGALRLFSPGTFTPLNTSPHTDADLPANLSRLPLLAYPNGTRYPHPLPPSAPNPWPRSPHIARSWLSASRLRQTRGQPLRTPRGEYDLSDAYVNASDAVWAARRAGCEDAGLNRGEGFDVRGRPTRVPREVLYDGKKAGWAPKGVGEPRALPKVQHFAPGDDPRSAEEKEPDTARREWVRRAFLHLWGSYVKKADTLLLMGLEDEYLLARTHIAAVDFSYLTPRDPTRYVPPSASSLPPLSAFDLPPHATLNPLPEGIASPAGVPTFEAIIRYLGGLLAAYDLSHDPLMLSRATELGDWLLAAFAMKDGLLVPTYRMGAHSDGGPSGEVCLAEVGSVGLELLRLSQLTGDWTYFEAAQRSLDTLDEWPAHDRIPGLFPTVFDANDPERLWGRYTFGGQADSYYEYLLKLYQLLGGSGPAAEQYARMYPAAIDAAHEHLVREIEVVPGLEDAVTIGDVHYKEMLQGEQMSWFSMRLDHLTCFAGGMLGLGARLLKRSKDLFTKACTWAYDATRTGLAPEIVELWAEKNPRKWEVRETEGGHLVKAIRGDPPGVYSSVNYHIQRPETIESVWYMYRLTGDRAWQVSPSPPPLFAASLTSSDNGQDKAWQMFTSWVEATVNEGGFAHIDDVNSPNPVQDDSGVESFVYGETLKYYFLTFSPPDFLSLDDWVLSTEAKTFRLPKPGAPPPSVAPFWPADAPPLTMPDEREIGRGTPVQRWARMVQAAAMRGFDWRARAE